MAAQHRRQVATEECYRNPPKPEDIWICEFCEYERIFGYPPKILIRSYEIKDRKNRSEEAERKRLLQKAKAKSRRGRKNGRAPVRGAPVGSQDAGQVQGEPSDNADASSMQNHHSLSSEQEEDYENQNDEGYPVPSGRLEIIPTFQGGGGRGDDDGGGGGEQSSETKT